MHTRTPVVSLPCLAFMAASQAPFDQGATANPLEFTEPWSPSAFRAPVPKAWFSDMDGTLFDGRLPPNPTFSKMLADLVDQLEERSVPFAYISGRRIGGMDWAMREYGLAVPAFVGASVGSEIYARVRDEWQAVGAYRDLMRARWVDDAAAVLDALMAATKLPEWRPSTSSTDFKRSYSVPNLFTTDVLGSMMDDALRRHGLDSIKAIVSGPGYEGDLHVDFVPDNGSKVHAAQFIARELLGLSDLAEVLFTGDSGNDIDLLLAAGAAALVSTNEAGLVEKLAALRPDIFFSQHPHILGVLHAMEHFGVIRP